MKLIKCKECEGSGEVDCCHGHMCPGTKRCPSCKGKKKVLSEKDRKIKLKLQKLMEYE